MTSEQRKRMDHLCRQIQIEQDPNEFTTLLIELDELLEANESDFAEDARRDPLLRPGDVPYRRRGDHCGHA